MIDSSKVSSSMQSQLSSEPRYHCPVCVSLPMKKLHLVHGDQSLVLDHCQHCGGMWFDAGEVQKLRQYPLSTLSTRIALTRPEKRTACRSCYRLIDRNVSECQYCGHPNQIDCPICQVSMHQKKVLKSVTAEPKDGVKHQEARNNRGIGQRAENPDAQSASLTLDICHQCHGVWFDANEILDIWLNSKAIFASNTDALSNLPPAFRTVMSKRSAAKHHSSTNGMADITNHLGGSMFDAAAPYGVESMVKGGEAIAEISAEAIAQTPEVSGAVVETTAAGIESAGEALAQAGEFMGEAAVEVTGEFAAFLVECIAGILSNLS